MADHKLEEEAEPTIQFAYFNGFALALGNSDFSIRLRLDNTDFVELKASFTTVKTLAQNLTEMVKHFEEITGHPLMTNRDVLKAIQKTPDAPSPDAGSTTKK